MRNSKLVQVEGSAEQLWAVQLLSAQVLVPVLELK